MNFEVVFSDQQVCKESRHIQENVSLMLYKDGSRMKEKTGVVIKGSNYFRFDNPWLKLYLSNRNSGVEFCVGLIKAVKLCIMLSMEAVFSSYIFE